MACSLRFYDDGISFHVVFSQSFWLRVLPHRAHLVQPRWMPERRILGGDWTCDVLFWPFPNSSGWSCLISSMFLSRTSCHKTTHANGYYGAWPGWAVSISVLPLTMWTRWINTLNYFSSVHGLLLISLKMQQPPIKGTQAVYPLVYGILHGQNTEMGSLSHLQGIFPTQGSNPGLLHCRWILYHLSHKGSPFKGREQAKNRVNIRVILLIKEYFCKYSSP